jgi:RNA polymerase sigma-70 factor (ECF subfamily)
MGDPADEFRHLMERVFAGDQAAAGELLAHYEPAVRRAVRRALNRRLRPKFDSLDFVQDVWKSFFAKPPPAEPFHDPEQLIAFLTEMARHKVVDATRQRLQGQKYNLNREQSLDNSTVGGPGAVPGHEPTPSEALGRREEVAKVLDSLPLVYRRVMVLLSEGQTPEEIAREMNLPFRYVRRIVHKLVARLTA